MLKNKKIRNLLFSLSLVPIAISFTTISLKCNLDNQYENPQFNNDIVPKNFSGLNGLPYPISNKLEANKATKINVAFWNDGDTFRDTNGNIYRFAGIDTPEYHKKGSKEFTTGLQFKYAKLAKQYTETYTNIYQNDSIKGKPTEVYVVPQKTKGGKTNISDKYGRIVAIIYYKNNLGQYYNLCSQILYFGKAKKAYISLDTKSIYYTTNTKYYNELQESERVARKNKIGIWENENDIYEIYPKR
ncbi:thermonuclease family protein [Metamycoplasma buccale]|uniref:thermonuclease family protein n=1 Tax=Metamycoplasma buccale TaxID=55602 RepID=UPI00398E4659